MKNSVLIVIIFFVAFLAVAYLGVKSSEAQCRGNNQFYSFNGRVYLCENWEPGK